MYLKPERYSYRRRRSSFWRTLILLMAVGGALFLLYNLWSQPETTLPILNTVTPAPTPTRSATSLNAEADDLYWNGKIDEAIAAYQQSLLLDPEQPKHYETLARLLILRGRPERGLEMIREALRLNPKSVRAWALLGMAYDWLNLPQEALTALTKARTLDDTYPETYAYLAEAYMDLGNWFAANDAIQTALQLDDTNLDVLRDYGYVLEMQGNYAGAIEQYRLGLQRPSYIAHLYVAMGRNAQALSNYPAALEYFQAAVTADPANVVALDLLGYAYLLQGDYNQATTHLEKAVETDPYYGRAAGHLGTLYFQQRNYEDAIPAFKNAIQYGEAESRRRTVFLVVTEESAGAIGDAPAGTEVARGELRHPADPVGPLRALVQGSAPNSPIQGRVRLEVLSGRYVLQLSGMPQPAPGKVYIAWFVPLFTPEQKTVHTDPLIPTADGKAEANNTTGAVKGPSIEFYYTLALCHYFLDQCNQATPYIQTALRLAPADPTVLQTQRLCGTP